MDVGPGSISFMRVFLISFPSKGSILRREGFR